MWVTRKEQKFLFLVREVFEKTSLRLARERIKNRLFMFSDPNSRLNIPFIRSLLEYQSI